MGAYNAPRNSLDGFQEVIRGGEGVESRRRSKGKQKGGGLAVLHPEKKNGKTASVLQCSFVNLLYIHTYIYFLYSAYKFNGVTMRFGRQTSKFSEIV